MHAVSGGYDHVFVPWGRPPRTSSQRLAVLEKMVQHTHSCPPGDKQVVQIKHLACLGFAVSFHVWCVCLCMFVVPLCFVFHLERGGEGAYKVASVLVFYRSS